MNSKKEKADIMNEQLPLKHIKKWVSNRLPRTNPLRIEKSINLGNVIKQQTKETSESDEKRWQLYKKYNPSFVKETKKQATFLAPKKVSILNQMMRSEKCISIQGISWKENSQQNSENGQIKQQQQQESRKDTSSSNNISNDAERHQAQYYGEHDYGPGELANGNIKKYQSQILTEKNHKGFKETKIQELQNQNQNSKLFMNMVIHDLRNPSESIYQGLKQARQMMDDRIDSILQETERVFKQQYRLTNERESNTSQIKEQIDNQIEQSMNGISEQNGANRLDQQVAPRVQQIEEEEKVQHISDDGDLGGDSQQRSFSSVSVEQVNQYVLDVGDDNYGNCIQPQKRLSQKQKIKNKMKSAQKSIIEANKKIIDIDRNLTLQNQKLQFSNLEASSKRQKSEIPQSLLKNQYIHVQSKPGSGAMSLVSKISMKAIKEEGQLSDENQLDYFKSPSFGREIQADSDQDHEAAPDIQDNADVSQILEQDDDFVDFSSNEFNEEIFNIGDEYDDPSASLLKHETFNDNKEALAGNPQKHQEIQFQQVEVFVDKRYPTIFYNSVGCNTDAIDREFLIKSIEKTDEYKLMKEESENYQRIMGIIGIPRGEPLTDEVMDKLQKAFHKENEPDQIQELSGNQMEKQPSISKSKSKEYHLQNFQQFIENPPKPFSRKELLSKSQSPAKIDRSNPEKLKFFKQISRSNSCPGIHLDEDYRRPMSQPDFKEKINTSPQPEREQHENSQEQLQHLKKPKNTKIHNILDQSRSEQSYTCYKCIIISKHHLKCCNQLDEFKERMDLYIQNSIYSAYMINNMVNDLLDLASLEKSTFHLRNEYFNMYEVVIEAFSIVSFQAELRQISLYLVFDQSKPYIFCKVYNDKRRFLQIFLNFISNSLKFTQEGGFIKVHLKILEEQITESSNFRHPNSQKSRGTDKHEPQPSQFSRGAKKANSTNMIAIQEQLQNKNVLLDQMKYVKLQLIIEDNGLGISPLNQQKLFQDYSKLNEHSQINQKGTGLGLSICKKIVEQMDGKVGIESEVGVGSQFMITICTPVIDKQIFNNEPKSLNSKEKINYVKSLGAFNYANNFYQKFTEMDQKQIEESSADRRASFGSNISQQIHKYSKATSSDEIHLSQRITTFQFKMLSDQISNNESGLNKNRQRIQNLSNALAQSQLREMRRSSTPIIDDPVQISYNTGSQQNAMAQRNVAQMANDQSVSKSPKVTKPSDILTRNQLFQQVFNLDVNEGRSGSDKQARVASQRLGKSFFAYDKQDLRDDGSQSSFSENQNNRFYNSGSNNSLMIRSKSQKKMYESSKKSPTSYKQSAYDQAQSKRRLILDPLQPPPRGPISDNQDQINQRAFLSASDDNINKEEFKINEHHKQFENAHLSERSESSSQNSFLSSTQDDLLVKSHRILSKYKQKKLKILVANDDKFQLFIISNFLEILTHIDTIDSANNGQEALDLVRVNERSTRKRYYDLIFLDLNMPIKDGYDACKAIIDHYASINLDIKASEQSSGNWQEQMMFDMEIQSVQSALQNKRWLKDVKFIYNAYLQSVKQENDQRSQIPLQQSGIDDKSVKTESQKILVIFRRLYRNVKFRALSNIARPWIFAYSAQPRTMCIDEVLKCGFDEFFEAPITVKIVQGLIDKYVHPHCNNFIESKIQNPQKEEKLVSLIKLQSSDERVISGESGKELFAIGQEVMKKQIEKENNYHMFDQDGMVDNVIIEDEKEDEISRAKSGSNVSSNQKIKGLQEIMSSNQSKLLQIDQADDEAEAEEVDEEESFSASAGQSAKEESKANGGLGQCCSYYEIEDEFEALMKEDEY